MKMAFAVAFVVSLTFGAVMLQASELSPEPVDFEMEDASLRTFPAKATGYDLANMAMERYGRGFVAFRCSDSEVCASWRYNSSDSMDVAFSVYCNGTLVNDEPISKCAFMRHENPDAATSDQVYELRPVKPNGEEFAPEGYKAASWTVKAGSGIGYLAIPLKTPPKGMTAEGVEYSYFPGDCSVADADGDGELEIFLKWNPSLCADNANAGHTGTTKYECFKLDGTPLWERPIECGPNIRSGEHYTNFVVYDLDGDGKAEFVIKTADMTTDTTGKNVSLTGDWTNWVRFDGYILDGPEYLTVFEGATGRELKTVEFKQDRGDVWSWGDSYGNRVDRFTAGIAWLDGRHPSVVIGRGYYARSTVSAWDWDGKDLTARWVFDTTNTTAGAYVTGKASDYMGQGFHCFRTGDVDFDGTDEIVYGSMVVDDDGRGLYSTLQGHGDAMHLVQVSPVHRGLQVWTCHEHTLGVMLREAGTGEVLKRVYAGKDTARAMAGDVDGESYGYELWASTAMGTRNCYGEFMTYNTPSLSCVAWWFGDLERGGCGTTVDRFSAVNGGTTTRVEDFGSDVVTINGTKGMPCLQADIIGDWREEIILPTSDGTELRVFISAIPTDYRFHTFLEDPVYRASVAGEQSGYNQPTQTGFYFGPDLLGHGLVFRGCRLP